MDASGDIKDGHALLLDAIYPIGIIFSSTVNTSPAALLGGTWSSLQGMVLMAEDGTTNYTAGNTGGSKDITKVLPHSHVGTTNTNGNHTHTVTRASTSAGAAIPGQWGNQDSGANNVSVGTSFAGTHAHTFTTGSVGNAGVGDNMPPYLAVYMWERTA